MLARFAAVLAFLPIVGARVFGVRQISSLATIRIPSIHLIVAGSDSGAAVALAPFAVSKR